MYSTSPGRSCACNSTTMTHATVSHSPSTSDQEHSATPATNDVEGDVSCYAVVAGERKPSAPVSVTVQHCLALGVAGVQERERSQLTPRCRLCEDERLGTHDLDVLVVVACEGWHQRASQHYAHSSLAHSRCASSHIPS